MVNVLTNVNARHIGVFGIQYFKYCSHLSVRCRTGYKGDRCLELDLRFDKASRYQVNYENVLHKHETYHTESFIRII